MPWKLQKILLNVADGQDNWFRQVLQNVGKQTRFWKHHTSPQHDQPTRWQLVSCTCHCHWQRHTNNMWRQRSPTQNHWAHYADRLVHSSTGNFKLWFIVLQRFVRFIRSGNFPPCTQSLTKLVRWFVNYDHYQYARWVSVHLRGMMSLSPLQPYM